MTNPLTVRVTDAAFGAKGDGQTNDRAAIQAAIDHVSHNGGGTVVLDGNTTFLTAGLVLKTGVELHFEDGAVLLQSGAHNAYYKPVGDGYEPYQLMFGHNWSETIKWSHTWYKNYPFLFAPEGSHDFKITGNGVIRMDECTDPERVVRTCPIGFFRCHHFVISDVTINNYHGYAMMPFTCHHGLIRNVKIFEWSFGNGDGICLMNCQDMRITGCKMFTGDDSLYIFSSYRDPRRSEWWNSDEPQPSVNIEVDHNELESHGCKAFGMILWGVDCPDQEQMEVRNVYVHDNWFKTLGVWLYNPYTTNPAQQAVTDVRFENNKIEAIETNFFETQVSGLTGFRSMRTLRNGDFKDGRCWWLTKTTGSASVAFIRGENNMARLRYPNGSALSLYQGLYLKADELCALFVRGRTDGHKFRLFVRDAETDRLVAGMLFDNTEATRHEMDFKVPQDGNYRLGIEQADFIGEAEIFEVEFAGNTDTGTDYARVTKEGGKILYYYDVSTD